MLHSIKNMVGSRMPASVLIWRGPFYSHLCLQVWGQMFSPADNLLISTFGPCFFLCSLLKFEEQDLRRGCLATFSSYCLAILDSLMIPSDASGQEASPTRSRPGKESILALNPLWSQLILEKKSPEFLGFVAPIQFKRWPLETPGIITFTVAPHSIWKPMFRYWAKAKALKSMYRKNNRHPSGQHSVQQLVTLSLPTHMKECYCLGTKQPSGENACWPVLRMAFFNTVVPLCWQMTAVFS